METPEPPLPIPLPSGAREEFAALASITGGTETVLTALRLEVSTLPI
jgi:hypothetical protein